MKNTKFLDLFFASVNDEWFSQKEFTEKYTCNVVGEQYGNYYSTSYNGHHFNIDCGKGYIYIYSPEGAEFMKIVRFKFWFIPLNFKVCKNVSKVKHNVKNKNKIKEKDHQEQKINKIFEDIHSDKNMIIKLRKHKLKSIEGN